MSKFVWHDEELFSFEYSSSAFVIEKSAGSNDWHQMYCWKLYLYFFLRTTLGQLVIERINIRVCKTRRSAKRIASAIARG